MKFQGNSKKFLKIITLLIVILVGITLFKPGGPFGTYKLKDDISRVENEDHYSLTMEDLKNFLLEINPRANIYMGSSETDISIPIHSSIRIGFTFTQIDSPTHSKSGKYYSQNLYFNNRKFTGYSLEENGKLAAISVTSDGSYIRGSTVGDFLNDYPPQFKGSVVKELRKNANILNNILNASKTQQEFNQFTKQILRGKTIRIGESASLGDSIAILNSRDSYLIITFFPKYNDSE